MRQIDFTDEATVSAEIDSFITAHKNDSIEHALVLSPSGHVYTIRGDADTVNPGVVGARELRGSIVVHNHPPDWPDSFSEQDFMAFFEHGFSRQELVAGDMHHIMMYVGTSTITSDIAYDLYKRAFHEVQQHAMRMQIAVPDLEQLATMRQLSETLEGLIFNENPGR